MINVNPYESTNETNVTEKTAHDADRKRSLGSYDIAGALFVVAMLILLLAPGASNRGQPIWVIGLSGGCTLLLSVFVAAFGFARQRRRRVICNDPVELHNERSVSEDRH